MADPISLAAENVLRLLGMWRLPVDPFAIAKEERIVLSPGTYGNRFDARIEYLPDERRFVIYYRVTCRNEGRIRFSIGHELGHYYLDVHRDRLIHGNAHNSVTDYRSTLQTEQEADQFSANLLMPAALFLAAVRNYRQSVCTLKDLLELADRLGASVTSTAIRYCDLSVEPAMLVLSQDGIVQWSYAAEDMHPSGCWFVRKGTSVPDKSQTAKLLFAPGDEIIGHRVDPHTWFDWPKHEWIYEEAVKLGDRVLTWIVLDD